MVPSTGNKHDPNHDAQKKQRDIGEPGQLGKYHASIIRSRSVARSRKKKTRVGKIGSCLNSEGFREQRAKSEENAQRPTSNVQLRQGGLTERGRDGVRFKHLTFIFRTEVW